MAAEGADAAGQCEGAEVVAVVDQILMLLLMAHLVSVQVQTLMYLVETVVVILAPQVSHKVTPVVAVVV